MSEIRKQQARINGLKGGRKVRWEKPIKANDPRRKTHRWLVREDGKERLCKSKPSCPHVDLWRGPRPLCANMESQYDAWHKRTAPDISVHAAFRAGWVARGKLRTMSYGAARVAPQTCGSNGVLMLQSNAGGMARELAALKPESTTDLNG